MAEYREKDGSTLASMGISYAADKLREVRDVLAATNKATTKQARQDIDAALRNLGGTR